MRKGEAKRQELLNTAEQLFCQKGYEATSVQDILDALKLSKGGFYHHFASKEDVLKALCDRRAARAAAFTAQLLNEAQTPMDRVNAVLHGYIPLRREEGAFMAVMLPGLDKPEGRAIAMAYQDSLLAHFQPLLKAEIASASAAQMIFPPVKEIEGIVLNLINHCWMEAAGLILAAAKAGRQPEMLTLLHEVERYRRAVEVLLDAPYGTLEIIRVEEIAEFASRNI